MARNVAELQEEINWHWRNSMRPVRFFNFDARAAIPFCLLLFYFRIVTIVFAVCVMVVFWLLEKKGLTFDSAVRAIRLPLFGDKRPALTAFRYRKMRDLG